MAKVKICSITNAEDGRLAAELGADFLGFVVEIESSERSLEIKEAKHLIEQLKGRAKTVLLTDLLKGREVVGLCSVVRPDAVQLVNDIPYDEVFLLKHLMPQLKIFKTIHVLDKSALLKAKHYEKFVDYFILDSKLGKKLGGTGKKANWAVCAQIVKQSSRPVFLAGGLKAENVAEAIRKVKPFGVDVSGGVKMQSNKRKIDKDKLRKFIEAAKKA
ncbi:MAG: phosphoribosylanthranilate isomerase [Candidatus Diapherotrites archaeon]|nr:phosphoribosylanthranilate isomerase [Candidatus Diapherotrites archaeon]